MQHLNVVGSGIPAIVFWDLDNWSPVSKTILQCSRGILRYDLSLTCRIQCYLTSTGKRNRVKDSGPLPFIQISSISYISDFQHLHLFSAFHLLFVFLLIINNNNCYCSRLLSVFTYNPFANHALCHPHPSTFQSSANFLFR